MTKRIMLWMPACALVWPLAGQLLPRADPQEVGLSEERLDRIQPLEEQYVAQNQHQVDVAVTWTNGFVEGSK